MRQEGHNDPGQWLLEKAPNKEPKLEARIEQDSDI